MTKKELADAIVGYRARKEQQSITGILEVTFLGTNQVLSINVKRLINVIISPVVKPKFATRGKALKKEQLENGDKTGQEVRILRTLLFICDHSLWPI